MSDKSWEPEHSLTHSVTLTLSHPHTLTLSLSYSLTLDMLNNFFFMSMLKSHSLTFTLSLSHSFTLLFTHSRHAEQLLFSCLCSKVTVYSRGEWVLIDSANRPNEQLVSQDPFKSDGSQGRTSPEGEPWREELGLIWPRSSLREPLLHAPVFAMFVSVSVRCLVSLHCAAVDINVAVSGPAGTKCTMSVRNNTTITRPKPIGNRCVL